MSRPDRELQDEQGGEGSRAIASYEVGYARPPVEHRFRKGQSGNPGGRPKGAANKPAVNTGHGMRPAEEYLRMEAYRMVTLREGGELIELPAIQAVFRAMGISALKGNRFAQRTLADLVTGLEARDAEARMELFGNAIDYKREWTAAIERARAQGKPEPEPIPHPDDIVINPRTGEVTMRGPQTAEEKARYDQIIERRDEAQEEVSYFARKHRQARTDTARNSWLEEWHWEQRMFDLLNDALAPRYKVKLKDRSYVSGASREGETLQEFMDDWKKPPPHRRWDGYVE